MLAVGCSDTVRLGFRGVCKLTNHDTHIETLKQLKKDLASACLKWSEVEKLLPDWHEQAVKSPTGTLELKTLIARQFGLKLESDGHLLRLSSANKSLFKTRSNTTAVEVEPAQAIATSVARIVARATTTEYHAHKIDAKEVRKEIVESSSNKWVSFSSLVDHCWSLGIPVVYLPEFPTKGKKMEGMVTKVGSRPVIVLSRKAEPDWMLFILAHELGHLASRHLEKSESATILDEHVTEDDGGDVQEKEANKFASDLIASSKILLKQLIPARQLAIQATEFGKKNNVSPGHVILNAAKHTKIKGKSLWPLAQAAIKLLPEEATSPPVEVTCVKAIRSNVDKDLIKSDDLEFLENLRVL